MHYLSFLNPWVINFLLLLSLTYLIRRYYLRDAYSVTAAGGIVMAIGMFIFSALQHFPSYFLSITPYATLLCLLIWLFILESYLKCYLDGHFYIHTKTMLDRFNMGSWVVSSALLGMLWMQSFPELDEIAWVFTLVAVLLWIEYTRIAVSELRVMINSSLSLRLTGDILLLTVSMQSIALILHQALGKWLPMPIELSIILLGYMSYGACFILLMRYFLQIRARLVLTDWNPANSLLYGALAICGLASISIGIIPHAILWVTWIAAIILFLLVEGVAILRFVRRFYRKGWKAAMIYDVSEWLRYFSYGVMYAFTAAILPMQHEKLKSFTLFVVDVGQYVLLGFLLIEAVIFFQAKYKPLSMKTAPCLEKCKK